ncbi:sigma-54-dependent Fis family transcriptional regulator, partial [bacterium]|nr:sigma-54-dependent Fis family transcriptional regulator [bacterium]
SLFLDEIGELPPSVQASLLTFLDSHTFRRVGGTRVLRADVRLLVATNVDLKQAGERGAFRRDLYFRLSVVPITVPPLRSRREDIGPLARSILAELARRSGRHRIALDRSVVSAFERYEWPGNVRELRNVLERALIVSRGAPLAVEHLPPEIRQGAARVDDGSRRLDDVERRHILGVLESVDGNRTRAAEILGIGRSTLKRKLKELRLEPDGDPTG